jgi:hypothetical protein
VSKRWLFATVAAVVGLAAALWFIAEKRYDPTLQEWSYIATALAAVATLALVAAAFVQLSAISQQLDLDREAVNTSKRSAEAAVQSAEAAAQSALASERAAREATRARADDQAPRIVATFDAPAWPPYIDRILSEFPAGEEIFAPAVAARRVQVDPTREFVFPLEENQLLWFITRGRLKNEGRASARVSLDGGAIIFEHSGAPTPIGMPGRREFLLQPDELVVFQWATGHPLREWAEKHDQPHPATRTLSIYSSDFTEHMIRDVTKVELAARPLEPVPRRDGGWKLIPNEQFNDRVGITVYPTERRYLSEEKADS